jgi:hypothetical protein
MPQDRKRGFFGSLFGSRKKREEELEAQRKLRQKIEERIDEVLAVHEVPDLIEPEQAEAGTYKPAA